MGSEASRRRGVWQAAWPWLLAAVLMLPVVAVLAAHHAWPRGDAVPTGFVQFDQPYYMANAREHWDPDGRFHLFYGLPASKDYDTPRIYAQPLSLLLGTLHHVTGADPGALYAGFGVVAGIVCFRLLIALWQALHGFGGPGRKLAFLLLCWGGGVLTLAGLLAGVFDGRLHYPWILRFDPVDGYWFLNFGRNMHYTTEATYHALVVAVALLVVRRRFGWAVAVLAVLSVSHPFTGLQTLLVLLGWSALEAVVLRTRSVSKWFPALLVLLLAAHLGYYLVFLSRSPEHRIVAEFWKIPWVLGFQNALLAYLPVAWMVYRRGRIEGWQGLLATPTDRMWAVWACVSFGLAKHDLLIEPHQPLHFTRGYIWTPLFLLGAPWLIAGLEACWRQRRFVMLALVAALFWADNAYWFGEKAVALARGTRAVGFYLSPDDRELFRELNEPRHTGRLLASLHHETMYLATVYTPLRGWIGHAPTTPHNRLRWAELEGFFLDARLPDEWRRRDMLLIVDAVDVAEAVAPWYEPQRMEIVGRYGDRVLIRRPPD